MKGKGVSTETVGYVPQPVPKEVEILDGVIGLLSVDGNWAKGRLVVGDHEKRCVLGAIKEVAEMPMNWFERQIARSEVGERIVTAVLKEAERVLGREYRSIPEVNDDPRVDKPVLILILRKARSHLERTLM